MNSAKFPVAVVMERQKIDNPWASWRWEARGVTASGSEQPSQRVLREDEALRIVLFDGHSIELHRDEAEGYFLNLNAPQPKVFVMWRQQDGEPLPHSVTVSYHEAARLLDAGEQVDAVPMPVGLAGWVAEFVQEHYKPEPKKVRRRDRGAEAGR